MPNVEMLKIAPHVTTKIALIFDNFFQKFNDFIVLSKKKFRGKYTEHRD